MNTSISIRFFLKINVLLVLIIGMQCNQVQCQDASQYAVRKVVIDAGHGGKDPGAVGLISKEKDIALKIALKVGNYIENSSPDIEVIYTRKEDKFVHLDERSKIANDAGADLFISIHCNANVKNSPNGTETYVMGLHRSSDNLDVAMRENAVITYEDDYSSRYEGYDPKSSESFIIFSMLQNAHLDQSLNLASLIQNDFKSRLNRKDRGVKQAGFIVLWKTSMPSVLVEVGYLSNPKEEIYLNSTEGQDHLASSIYRAFKEYKKSVDDKNGMVAKNNFSHTTQNKATKSSAQPNPQYGNKETNLNPIVFKVQLLASSKKIAPNTDQFKAIENVEEIQSNGVYKYCVGNMKSYNDILTYCQEIKKIYPDAFVIALKEGSQIPVDTAIKEIENHQTQQTIQ